MMDRRVFFGTMAVGIVAVPVAAVAQRSAGTFTVGFLSLGMATARPGLLPTFMEAMQQLGYVEGKNLVIKRAYAEFNADRLPDLAAGLVRARADVIVTTSTRETLAAKQATSTIPIVMTLVPDPVAQGFVTSLAQPGGNVTGLTNLVPGLSQKLVEFLKQIAPSALRFVVIAGLGGPNAQIRHELEAAASRLGISVSFAQVNGPKDIDTALELAKQAGASGIIVAQDTVTYAHRLTLVRGALKHRLPAIYWAREYVEDGGLMAYAAPMSDIARRAASYVDKILKGTRPADLPIEQPAKFELVINLKTAKALTITVPPSLLARADELIE